MAEVDESAWDGKRAYASCETAADFRAICAGEKTVGEADERQHWALPHHYLAGPSKAQPPNRRGVQAALGRVGQTQDLKSVEGARTHLERHQSAISESASAGRSSPPLQNLIRMVAPMARTNVYALPDVHLRALTLDEPNVMVGYMAVFDSWAEIDTWEGRFRERFRPGSLDKTLREARDKFKVLFNHGFDGWVTDNVLGVPRTMKPDKSGLWVETPLLDTDYNRDRIRPQLEAGAIPGQSIQFSVVQERWNLDTDDGVPERDVIEAKLFEGGPVTWPAYEATTVGVRTRAQYDLWRNGKEAAPPDEAGRVTDEADAPAHKGQDTSAEMLARLQRELDQEGRRAAEWAERTI